MGTPESAGAPALGGAMVTRRRTSARRSAVAWRAAATAALTFGAVVVAPAAAGASLGPVAPHSAHHAHPTAPQARQPLRYGEGRAFCDAWGGVAPAGLGIANTYPCAATSSFTPKVDIWGVMECSDFTRRYEYVRFGLTLADSVPQDGGVLVRDFHTYDHVPIATTGPGQIPEPGDALSIWNGSDPSEAGHTGVVYSTDVSAEGNGTITYLDENGMLEGGVSRGFDILYVSDWHLSTHWTTPWGLDRYDWTVQPLLGDGSFFAVHRSLYEVVGGAPLPLTHWSAVGGPRSVVAASPAMVDSLRERPSNGTIVTADGRTYEFVGGAPLALKGASVAVRRRALAVDPVALETSRVSGPFSHVLLRPANGTVVRTAGAHSRGFVVAGGALIAVHRWPALGRVQPFVVPAVALAAPSWRTVPINGTALRTSTGATYLVEGGVPFAIPAGEARQAVLVDGWAITHRGGDDGLALAPADGTTVRPMTAPLAWTFEFGAWWPANATARATVVRALPQPAVVELRRGLL